jgi:ABC-type sugar transport system ATPase subunit
VLIGGAPMVGLPPRARKIAMVFQSYALYPHKSARKNIEFPLKAQGMEPEERAKKVEWAAGLLGITRLLERRPRHLSGGERQRVALARALVREPDVFLLDEPLSNLDAKLRTAARDDLKQFQDRIGTTTIYVTHDQVEAMGLGDRIAVMSEGKIRQLGTPHDVYHDPADTFVATFLGSPPMNMVSRDGTLIGFRPESLLPKGVVEADDGAVTVPFHVHRIEYLGSERHLVGTVSGIGEETRVISMLPATVSVDVPADETHEFVIRGADLRFFDKETGARTARQRL